MALAGILFDYVPQKAWNERFSQGSIEIVCWNVAKYTKCTIHFVFTVSRRYPLFGCFEFFFLDANATVSLSLISRVVTLFEFHLLLGLDSCNIPSEKKFGRHRENWSLYLQGCCEFSIELFYIETHTKYAWQFHYSASFFLFNTFALTVQSMGFFVRANAPNSKYFVRKRKWLHCCLFLPLNRITEG